MRLLVQYHIQGSQAMSSQAVKNSLPQLTPEQMERMPVLAPQGLDQGQQTRPLMLLPRQEGDIVTNLRPSVEAEAVLASRCMSPKDSSLEDHVGKELSVVAAVLAWTELPSLAVPGEVVEKIHSSMLLEDGTVVATASGAVAQQLGWAMGGGGTGVWQPALKFEVRKHRSTNGRDYLSIRRVLTLAKTAKKG